MAVFKTAPAPVKIAQPTIEEISLGLSSSIFTTYPLQTDTSSHQVACGPFKGISFHVILPGSGTHLPTIGSLGTQVTIVRSPSFT